MPALIGASALLAAVFVASMMELIMMELNEAKIDLGIVGTFAALILAGDLAGATRPLASRAVTRQGEGLNPSAPEAAVADDA